MQLGDAWSISVWVMKQVGLSSVPSDRPSGSHLAPFAFTKMFLPSGQPPVLTFPIFGTVSYSDGPMKRFALFIPSYVFSLS